MKLKIKNGVLSSCESMDETLVEIPEGVTTIGNSAFYNCKSLKEIVIPEGVTTIGNFAFENCESLKKIVIPESVTSIGNSAFENCKSLKKIVIPQGVTSIEESTFFSCTSLEEIFIPQGVTSIGEYAFSSCTSLKELFIPKCITKIGENTFHSCTSLEEIVIPEGVTIIGKSAFNYCSSLKKIVIPEGVRTIWDDTFNGCRSLEEIVIPKSVKTISKSSFENCTSLTEIVIPKSVKTIGNSAFQNCTSLTEIVIPEGVTTIARSALNNCKSLQKIVIPESVTTIEYAAFEDCTSLTEIVIPKGVKVIERYAFKKCTSLKEIVIPKGVTTIGEYAFKKCTSLEEIVIPESVTTIVSAAFSECTSLKEIVLPESVKTIASAAFSECTSLKKIVIPESVTTIEEYAFSNCTSLEEIVIPESVTKIEKYAFSNCSSLKEIVIPKGVKTIEESTYNGCISLKKCIVLNQKAIIKYEAFSNCDSLYDTNGFNIINKTLCGYNGKEAKIKIPDGVETVMGNFGSCKNICLPDSVKMIKNINIYSAEINIPSGYLQQQKELDKDATKILLEKANWINTATDKDIAALMLFQKNKEIKEILNDMIKKAPDKYLKKMCEILRELGSAKHCTKALELFTCYKKDISQETIEELKAVAESVEAEDVVSILSPNIDVPSNSCETNADSTSKKGTQMQLVDKSIESYCSERFVPFDLEKYLKKLSVNMSVFNEVKYKNSEVLAPSFVVECAVVPYMQQLEKKPTEISSYRTTHSDFKIMSKIDKIAAALDEDSFRAALDSLLGHGLPSALQILVPYGRYASGKQINALKARFKKWEVWSDYFSSGRAAIIVGKGAILLNDSREALLISDKFGFLSYAALIRNVSDNALRDSVLSDFSFEADGKRCFDLGGTTIEVTLNQDLTLQMFDVNAGKIVKSIPKLGNSTKKVESAKAAIADMKKNIKKVYKNRIDSLKSDFTTGRTISGRDWKTSYIENPVIRKIGELVVWSANKRGSDTEYEFMIDNECKLFDVSGSQIKLSNTDSVSVAHPLSMTDANIKKWRDYIIKNAIAQPFTQIFETVYAFDAKSFKKRYYDSAFPYFVLKGLERDGYKVELEYDKSLRLVFDESRAYIVLHIDDPYVYSPSMISINETVTLKDFHIRGKIMTKRLNHALFVMDRLCLENMIKANNIESVAANADSLNEKNILPLIDIAEKNGSTDCLTWLMEYKNTNFPDTFDDLNL